MTLTRTAAQSLTALLFALGVHCAHAADYPTPKEADWVAHDFRFHTGEVMENLRIHYTTIGTPGAPAVLVLHGTAGSGTSMLTSAFAGELFGPGQPLDAPDGHPKLLHSWPPKLLQAGRADYAGSGVMTRRAAASLRR